MRKPKCQHELIPQSEPVLRFTCGYDYLVCRLCGAYCDVSKGYMRGGGRRIFVMAANRERMLALIEADRIATEEARARQEAQRQEEEAQKARNGGLTDYEVRMQAVYAQREVELAAWRKERGL